MLRLKKANAEKAAAAAASSETVLAAESKMEVSDAGGDMASSAKGSANEMEEDDNGGGGLKLLGIGGKAVRGASGPAKKKGKTRTPGEIRIQKDITELDGGTVARVEFPNPNELTSFNVIVAPDSGPWVGAKYTFSFTIPALYPHEPPKVLCHTKIYHPNINLQGNVCLNILREDWKPVLDINAVIYGLIYLFYEPNPDDPLNREAADLYRTDKAQFNRIVRRTLTGQSHAGESFPKLI